MGYLTLIFKDFSHLFCVRFNRLWMNKITHKQLYSSQCRISSPLIVTLILSLTIYQAFSWIRLDSLDCFSSNKTISSNYSCSVAKYSERNFSFSLEFFITKKKVDFFWVCTLNSDPVSVFIQSDFSSILNACTAKAPKGLLYLSRSLMT